MMDIPERTMQMEATKTWPPCAWKWMTRTLPSQDRKDQTA